MVNFFKNKQKLKVSSSREKPDEILYTDFHFRPSPLLQALAPIQLNQRVTDDKYTNIKE